MKIIEGLKRLNVIEKRMASNSERINTYAAILSTERPHFGNEQNQEKEIRSLVQANEDLLKEYLNLKNRLNRTNLDTSVTIGKEMFVLADLLELRRGLGDKIKRTYMSLNDNEANFRLDQHRRGSYMGEKAPHVERMYKEEFKNDNLRRWNDLLDEIEQRLEVINATTDLKE